MLMEDSDGINELRVTSSTIRRNSTLLEEVSFGVSGVTHLIGRILMMQMYSFNFGFWFGIKSSFQFRISPKILQI